MEFGKAMAEIRRLNALLASVTAENQALAEREARSLEDWRELRAENDRLKASRLPDVEYARLDTMWQELVRERDAAVAKATTYERDWYEAKSEFGTASAKLREQVRELTSERDEAKRELDALKYPRAYLPPGAERTEALFALEVSKAEERGLRYAMVLMDRYGIGSGSLGDADDLAEQMRKEGFR